jgi:hypothetical protein
VLPCTTTASAAPSATLSGTGHVSAGAASTFSAYPPPASSPTTRRPSGPTPTNSPPGTIGSRCGAR